MRGRILLGVGLAAVLAAAVLAAPTAAWADGTGHFCDVQGLCMSMNGTIGDKVYGKDRMSGDRQEEIEVGGDPTCTHNGQPSEYVQWADHYGATENCPFSTVMFDKMYHGDEIALITSDAFSNDYVQAKTKTGEVYQANGTATGEDWIMVPGVLYVNVAGTDASGAPDYLCSNGEDNALIISTGAAECTWSGPS